MNNFAEEYVRVFNSITLDESAKEALLNKITEGAPVNKSYTKKQVALASVALIAVAGSIACLFKSNKIR